MSISRPHCGRGGTRHIGRLRVAAAELLTKYTDLDVRPEDISPATGRHRTDWRKDVYRWEVFARKKSGILWVGGCWLRMGDFVRQTKAAGGCHYNQDDEINPGAIKQ